MNNTKIFPFKKNDENILIPILLSGNFIKVSENFIDNIYKNKNKSNKYILSLYMYLKVRVNESYTDKIEVSIREIANHLNANISSIHKALHELKNQSCDLLIQTSKHKSTIQLISDALPKDNFIQFEKNSLKKSFSLGVNATTVYSYIYSKIHQQSTYSYGTNNDIRLSSKTTAEYLNINKDKMRETLEYLKNHKLILKETKRRLGSIIKLTNEYVSETHIRKEIEILNPYSKQENKNKPIYQTDKVKINPYSKRQNDEKPLLKKDKKPSKKPILKKLIKEPKKKDKDKVLFSESDKNGYNNQDTNNNKQKMINAEISLLENKKQDLYKKFNNTINLNDFTEVKSKHYDDKEYVYRLYYKMSNGGNNIKAYVRCGSYVFDLDRYISDMRLNYSPGDAYYIFNSTKWKQAFIRDFNKRKCETVPSNYELRIIYYVRDFLSEVQERIPMRIKSLYNELQKYSKLNQTIKKAFERKSPLDEKIERIKDFSKSHKQESERISKKLTTSIQNYKFDVTKEMMIDMFINRMEMYLEKNSTDNCDTNNSQEIIHELDIAL